MLTGLLITLLLVLLNGFFVAAEFAIVKVRESQLELKIREGNRFAIIAKHIVNHLDGYLAATQFGITLASLGLGWIGEPVVSKILISAAASMGSELSPELSHSIAVPVAFAIITFLHIIFGELAPKSLAIQYAEKTTMGIAYPLHFFYKICRPFIWILNGVSNFVLRIFGLHGANHSEIHSSDELKYLIQQGKESGEIRETDYDIIKNAFQFSESKVFQVMVPRTKIIAIDVLNYNDLMLDKIIEENFSRIPCYENSMDNIIGVIFLKELLLVGRKNTTTDIRTIIKPVSFIPKTKNLGTLLKEFQRTHSQMAIVVNEYGGTEGLVTLEDVLEELVGEIQDESDSELPLVEKLGENIFKIDANASIYDINDIVPDPFPVSDLYNTMSGLILNKIGRLPKEKEIIKVNNYQITILKLENEVIRFIQAELLHSV
ncbi:MAG: HlyC/CorC family transporter [Bacteroidetes bacterium]|nr:HlyC/CorC family transporter [Bacteroidota bacterium]